MGTSAGLSAAQMRALEQDAIDSGAATGLTLMERAGRGCVTAMLDHWPGFTDKPGRAVVLCGPGNNGGDGFVIARLLKARNWQVDVHFLGKSERLPPDARVNHDRWKALGDVQPFEAAPEALTGKADLVVDAVFGTGLSREVPDAVRDTLLTARRHARLAVDFPSFIDTDTGGLHTDWPDDAGAAADLTVTFHAMKRGHMLPPGADLCGKVKVVDIGL